MTKDQLQRGNALAAEIERHEKWLEHERQQSNGPEKIKLFNRAGVQIAEVHAAADYGIGVFPPVTPQETATVRAERAAAQARWAIMSAHIESELTRLRQEFAAI